MKQFFIDETGKLSMKRVCGLLCTITLCVAMYRNVLLPQPINPSEILIESVTFLAFGCLGLSSIDKIFKNKKPKNEDK